MTRLFWRYLDLSPRSVSQGSSSWAVLSDLVTEYRDFLNQLTRRRKTHEPLFAVRCHDEKSFSNFPKLLRISLTSVRIIVQKITWHTLPSCRSITHLKCDETVIRKRTTSGVSRIILCMFQDSILNSNSRDCQYWENPKICDPTTR